MVTRKDDEKSASFWIKAEYLFINLTDDLTLKRILSNEISFKLRSIKFQSAAT
jgi:hypothetical protein